MKGMRSRNHSHGISDFAERTRGVSLASGITVVTRGVEWFMDMIWSRRITRISRLKFAFKAIDVGKAIRDIERVPYIASE